jgi:uncharacterized membrane protein
MMMIREMFFIPDFRLKYEKTIYEILFCFILCGIIGWIWETFYVLIMYGDLTDRGILFISRIIGFPIIWGLPFILIYGVGGAIMIWCFKPLSKKPVVLFFVCMVSMTVFEYFASLIYEMIWHQTLWDYSDQFLNLNGRVCLKSSLAWGVLGVLSVKLLGPLFHQLNKKIKNVKVMHIVIIILVISVLICYILRPILFQDMVLQIQVT